MTHPIVRHVVATLVGAAAMAVPFAAATVTGPATSTAQCPPGETGVIYGCAPFCVPGKFLDMTTGLCTPLPPPPPPAPRY